MEQSGSYVTTAQRLALRSLDQQMKCHIGVFEKARSQLARAHTMLMNDVSRPQQASCRTNYIAPNPQASFHIQCLRHLQSHIWSFAMHHLNVIDDLSKFEMIVQAVGRPSASVHASVQCGRVSNPHHSSCTRSMHNTDGGAHIARGLRDRDIRSD